MLSQLTQDKLTRAGSYCAAALLFSIPFSTAVSNILSASILILWLLSGKFRSFIPLLKSHAVVTTSLLLLVALVIGTSYSSVPLSDALSYIKKYNEYLLLVLLIPFLQTDDAKNWMHRAFVLCCSTILVISYLQFIELIPKNELGSASISSSITHSLIISFFAYYCLHQAKRSLSYRWFFLFLSILSIINIYFVIDSRTGQIIFIILAVLFSAQHLKRWQALSVTLFIVISSLYLTTLNSNSRWHTATNQLFDNTNTLALNNSTAMRLRFWDNSIQLIKNAPWIGYGTGSFSLEYNKLVPNDSVKTSNAHNEYMMHMIQLGIVGLILYLMLFISMLYCSQYQDKTTRMISHSIILCLAINSLIGSSFLDHAEGHWFACMIAWYFSTCTKKPKQQSV